MCIGHGPSVDWWALGIFIYEMLCGNPPFSMEGASSAVLFEKILTAKVEYPTYFSPHAVDLISNLLVVDSSRRLGCLANGVQDIKSHAWFHGLDFQAVLQSQSPGPITPTLYP